MSCNGLDSARHTSISRSHTISWHTVEFSLSTVSPACSLSALSLRVANHSQATRSTKSQAESVIQAIEAATRRDIVFFLSLCLSALTRRCQRPSVRRVTTPQTKAVPWRLLRVLRAWRRSGRAGRSRLHHLWQAAAAKRSHQQISSLQRWSLPGRRPFNASAIHTKLDIVAFPAITVHMCQGRWACPAST